MLSTIEFSPPWFCGKSWYMWFCSWAHFTPSVWILFLKWKERMFREQRAVCVHHATIQFSSVQYLSRVHLFVTPWTAAHQPSLSIPNSQSLLKLMYIRSVMPSNHLILLSPSPPAPNPSQHQSPLQWVNSSHEVAKVLEFQLSIIPSKEIPGLISFRMDWLDLLAVQGILKSLL